ncbi:redoxin domain-containing protein [Salinimicrobium sp. CAU 1759]
MPLRSSILLLISTLLFGCAKQPTETVIKGEVVGFTTKSILLLKPHQNLRFDNILEIPVENGVFEQALELDHPEGYYLLIGEARENAGGRLMPLFLEEGEIDLKIYPEADFEKNVVEGGKLNQEYQEYKRRLDQQNFESWKDQQEWTRNYISSNTSLVSYFLLLQELTSGWEIEDLEFHRKSYNKLAAAFPKHPYSILGKNLIEGQTSKIKQDFIDFSAPDLEGNMITFSDEIEGEVALLNLWATWCAPCIKKSREIIPVVEKYKEKGFSVIGVAGEFRTTENLENFLAKKEFPWLNLVELDRQNDLWTKYGVPNSGGAMFLIGRDGKILMKNPTAEELDEKLATLLP